MPSLLISVRFHDGRYHGTPEWPPSPARLFQALVAGAAQGETLAEEDRRAFAWLESLGAPVIAAPPVRRGQVFNTYVPNNDLDTVGGDLARIGKVRAAKLIRPILFDVESPLLYSWTFDHAPEVAANVQRICAATERLYQLGRGIDMAWGWAEILEDEVAQARLAAEGGSLHRPGDSATNTTLAVPLKGSLESLVQRHERTRERFQTVREVGRVFAKPPRPRFRQVAYDAELVRLLFDLICETASWRLDQIVELTEQVRDAAAKRLKDKRPDVGRMIDRSITGHRDADEADKAARVRIVPLPSIGHRHADQAIRRILVEIPPNCPLRADDLEWAFSGLLLVTDDGEIIGELAEAADRGMLGRYGGEDAEPAHLWRTITPAALPQVAARRRIDPARRHAESKGGAERAEEESKAAGAVVQALRHAGVRARPLAIRMQREPFEAKGARAETFAAGARFTKERLWHVEMAFPEGVRGPLVIGDGRYLGLGLMAPVADAWREVLVFSLSASAPLAVADRAELLRAVRRALMALSRDNKGNVPPLFSGHEPDGAPAGSGRHSHVFLACIDREGRIEQLIVAAPWAIDRTARPDRGQRAEFDRVAASLETVRAGRLGVLALQIASADTRLTGPARTWESHTDYRPTRHAGRGKDPAAALLRDVAAECQRRGLPRPEVEVLNLSVGPNEGIAARLRLRFAAAVTGPILLGRDSHHGGGLFEATIR
jgi:CRISPR-associated protein Csb2